MQNESKNSFLKWVKTHKKELVIAGISVTAIVALILGYRNRKRLTDLWTALQLAISKAPETTPSIIQSVESAVEEVEPTIESVQLLVVNANNIEQIPYEVSKHIRNLPQGWHPSAEKIATAAENGIQLLPNQTWVMDYMKGGIAA